jgi:hypothetical protein
MLFRLIWDYSSMLFRLIWDYSSMLFRLIWDHSSMLLAYMGPFVPSFVPYKESAIFYGFIIKTHYFMRSAKYG